jgi:quercetin dioxygenase-like cupin family protein
MGVAHGGEYRPMDEDADDFRPSSSWLLQVDPDGRTKLSVIRESVGVGDRIPRHWHDVDEVVLYERGSARVHVDGVDSDVAAGSSVFIPAGAIHGTVNTGGEPLEIRAVYPTTDVRMDLVERNPMPGTEDEPPRASRYDMATAEFTYLGDTELPEEYRASRYLMVRMTSMVSASVYSHSIVPGGLEVTSRTTRLISRTSLVMRVEMRSRTS